MNVSQLARQEAGLSLTSLLSEDGTHRWDAQDMAKEAQCLEPSALCSFCSSSPPPPTSVPSFAQEVQESEGSHR